MFAALFRRLTAPASGPGDTDDARLALAALLVRLARADGHYDPAEIARIDAVLAGRYGLTPAQTAALRADAETLESRAPDTVRFTRALKEAVPHEARFGLLEAMWAVVLADGARDALEDSHMRVIADLLGINDRDSARARQAAIASESRS